MLSKEKERGSCTFPDFQQVHYLDLAQHALSVLGVSFVSRLFH